MFYWSYSLGSTTHLAAWSKTKNCNKSIKINYCCTTLVTIHAYMDQIVRFKLPICVKIPPSIVNTDLDRSIQVTSGIGCIRLREVHTIHIEPPTFLALKIRLFMYAFFSRWQPVRIECFKLHPRLRSFFFMTQHLQSQPG